MQTEFIRYNHLGFFNPFFIKRNGEFIIRSSFKEIEAIKSSENILDILTFSSILTSGFAMGDRTLVEGIEKSPWMTKIENNSVFPYLKTKFGNEIKESKEVAKVLFRLLREEILTYIGKHKTIGLLLTGGMDSRMVAGALDSLVRDKELDQVNIVALTWGDSNSRDVIYAKEIAKRMKWEWRHFKIDAEQLKENIFATAIRGAEYAPNHLHAMLKVRELVGLDCILAASFGDSIGRGEYSGRTTIHLRDIRYKINNKYGLLKFDPRNKFKSEFEREIMNYHKKFPQDKAYQQVEQDYQIHYMRRMLNPCLSVINEKIPLFQAFTGPELVQFMLSLDPMVRNNHVYKEMLNLFQVDMSDIPWARTGLVYDKQKGSPDSFSKGHTDYSEIIKSELLPFLETKVLSNSILNLELLNEKSLVGVFKLIRGRTYLSDFNVEQILLWLASLSIFIETFQVKNDTNIKEGNFIASEYNAHKFLFRNKLGHINAIKKNLF